LVKVIWNLSIHVYMSNLKLWSWKKTKAIGNNMHNYNWHTNSQTLFYNFFQEKFLMWFSPQDLVYEPLISNTKKSRIAMYNLASTKSPIEKSWTLFFKIKILILKLTLKDIQLNKTTRNSSLIRFNPLSSLTMFTPKTVQNCHF